MDTSTTADTADDGIDIAEAQAAAALKYAQTLAAHVAGKGGLDAVPHTVREQLQNIDQWAVKWWPEAADVVVRPGPDGPTPLDEAVARGAREAGGDGA